MNHPYAAVMINVWLLFNAVMLVNIAHFLYASIAAKEVCKPFTATPCQLGLARVVCAEGCFPPHPGSIPASDMLSS
jgi:hypothetical protein